MVPRRSAYAQCQVCQGLVRQWRLVALSLAFGVSQNSSEVVTIPTAELAATLCVTLAELAGTSCVTLAEPSVNVGVALSSPPWIVEAAVVAMLVPLVAVRLDREVGMLLAMGFQKLPESESWHALFAQSPPREPSWKIDALHVEKNRHAARTSIMWNAMSSFGKRKYVEDSLLYCM